MTTRFTISLVIVLGAFTAFSADDALQTDSAKSKEELPGFIGKAVAPMIKDQPGIGVVVGVRIGDEQQVFGFGKVKLNGVEVTPDGETMFEIASATKAITGTLLGDLVHQHEVRLDDPAQKYLPAELQLPRRDDRDVTMLHLATHTSSLPPQPPGLPMFALLKPAGPTNPYKHYLPADLASTLKSITLKRPIGSVEEYSNLGAGILGIALANAAKLPSFEQLLEKRITQPLNMKRTKITLSDEDRAQRLAPGHNGDGEPASTWDFGCLEACGGVRSTVHDMLLFGQAALAQDDKQPLTPAFKIAQQPWRELKGGKGLFSGLHWVRMPSPNEKNTLIWHNGQTGGYRSFVGMVPDRKLVVVLLANVARNGDGPAMSIIKYLEKR